MSDTLRIGKSDGRRFELPRNAATQKIAFLGRTGTGKSYAAMKVAEEMHAAGAQIVTLDPVGIWWGLRLAADGEKPGIEIPVLGGLHGDIPLAPTSGELMADLVVDGRRSVILDVSQFESDAEKARFVSAFGDRFFRRMKAAPAPVHVFLEECQEFVPQNPADGEALMLHHWTRLAKLGRNFGIGLSLITQRPQEVNKKVLNMTELLLAFQMTGTHERKTIKEWLGSKGADGGDSVLDVLRELPVGTARVSSPQWLRFEGIVAVGERWTYDSSSTPDFESTEEPVEVAPLDLAELQQAMAATIEEQAANDPKALRKQIAELERQLRERAPGGVPEDEVEDRIWAAVTQAREEADAAARARVEEAIGALRVEVRPHVEALQHVFLNGWQPPEPAAPPAPAPPARAPRSNPVPEPRPRAVAPARRPVAAPATGKLPEGERLILTAIAQYPGGITREQIGILTGYKRSTRDAYIQRLASKEFVYAEGGMLRAYSSGVDALGDDFEPLPTGDALRAFWMDRLPEGERAVLEAVATAYPGTIGRDDVSELTGYKRSTRDAYLQRLGTRRLITSVGRGEVRASDELFSRGARR